MPIFRTKAEWYQSKEKAIELRKLLDNPILKEALEVLKDEQCKLVGKLIQVAVPTTGALSEYSLQKQAYDAGYLTVLSDLESLTQTPRPHEPPKPTKPWGHTNPPSQE